MHKFFLNQTINRRTYKFQIWNEKMIEYKWMRLGVMYVEILMLYSNHILIEYEKKTSISFKSHRHKQLNGKNSNKMK